MADTKITGLTALAAAPAVGDLFVLVDVSDTTMSADGTDKKITTANLFTSPTFTGAATATTFVATSGASVFPYFQQNTSLSSAFWSAYNAGYTVFNNGGYLVTSNSGANPNDADTGLTRISAGLWGVGTGAAGSFAGSMKMTDLQVNHMLGIGTAPTVAGNGSTNGSIAGSDSFSKVTVGTGSTTQITITFGRAYSTAPVCVVNAQTTTTPINVSTTTTTAVLTTAAFTAGEVLHVVCGGF